jgi:hypothetical protein
MNGFDSRQGQVVSLLHVVQAGSGAHPASYPIDTGGSSPGVKRPGREADHSPPSNADVTTGGAVLTCLSTGTTIPLPLLTEWL